ncbi:MAG: hypothetical protein E6I81_02475 [Chloroflexi bacterium]|nr:MAG: hypothetical protein E6I89_10675 [Chloroflexota bacterium]TMD74075.1 MAG: hypothetical protein E6I81_02475 [Chloroflexota bacterium]
MLTGERADAIADTVLAAVGDPVFALLDVVRDLLAPHRRVQAAGRRRARHSYRGGRHRNPCQDLDRERGAGAAQQRPEADAARGRPPGRNGPGRHRVEDAMELGFQLPLEVAHL